MKSSIFFLTAALRKTLVEFFNERRYKVLIMLTTDAAPNKKSSTFNNTSTIFKLVSIDSSDLVLQIEFLKLILASKFDFSELF